MDFIDELEKEKFDWSRAQAVLDNKDIEKPPIRITDEQKVSMGFFPEEPLDEAEFGMFFGRDALTDKVTKVEIIEKFLHTTDLAYIVAPLKTGKSIFSQQVAGALTLGADLFDTLRIPSKKKVLYLQLEGARAMVADQIKRLCNLGMIDIDNFLHVNAYGVHLNTDYGMEKMRNICRAARDNGFDFDVIFIDSLYMSFNGSICSDEQANLWNTSIKEINGTFKVATMVIHHPTKDNYDSAGHKIDKGDNMHGSGMLANFSDHILRLKKNGKKIECTCTTDRSGNIIGQINLTFNKKKVIFEPIVNKHEEATSLMVLRKMFDEIEDGDELHISEINDTAGVSQQQVYKTLRKLKQECYIEQTKRGYYRRML